MGHALSRIRFSKRHGTADDADHNEAAYLAAIVEASEDAIIGKTLNGVVTSWNGAAQRIFGYGAGEIVGRPIAVLFPPDRLGEDRQIAARIRSGERIPQYRSVRRGKDGRDIPVSLTVSPIRDREGHIVGSSQIVRDISESVGVEERLADSLRRSDELLAVLDTLQSAAPVGFAFIDRDFRVLRINAALAAARGTPAEEQIGLTLKELIPSLWPIIEPLYRGALEDNETSLNVELSGELTPGAGIRHWLVSTYPVRIGDTTIGAGGVVIEETGRKQIEAQLCQAQKMEAIGSLTGGVAHDFNNLLGVIIGNLDLLRPMIEQTDDRTELIDAALEAAVRGAELTSALLSFARRQPLLPHAVAPNAVVSRIVKLLNRVLGEDIEVVLDLSPEAWPSMADPAQLDAAIMNLANNARDAMPHGGRLLISTGNMRVDADYAAAHPEVKPGDYVAIEVSDTGHGMSQDIVSHIFEPFFTTKEPGKGTGLGLSMVFGFVKQSGGYVSVYSEVEVGTTFRLCLPRHDAGGETAERTETAAAPRGADTVLVVEDNAPLREAVLRQLKDLGYRVLEADTAKAAQAVLAKERIDVLLSDVVMPGGTDGLELARQVKQTHPDIRILLTSGFPGARFGDGGTLDGGIAFLRKPFRKTELAQALRSVLDRP